MDIPSLVRDLLLVALGYAAAELSAYLKAKRDRKVRIEERDHEDEVRRAERELADRRAQLDTCATLLAECHSIRLGVVKSRFRANEAVSRLRLLADDGKLAWIGSQHYVAASTGTSKAYEISMVAFINEARSVFGKEAIDQFEEYMQGDVHVDEL